VDSRSWWLFSVRFLDNVRSQLYIIHVDILTLLIHVVFKSASVSHYMPRWKKDQKEFTVSVTYHEHRGYQSYIPKPIMQMLGNPNAIKFTIKNKKIELEAGN
jgi:hypothetical protein